MLIYFLIPLYLSILSLINPKNKTIKNISFIVTAIFLCTTYFNGSDWRNYEILYNEVSFNNIEKIYGETGYHIYTLLFKSIGFDFWSFFIITKILVFYIFYLNMKKAKNPYLCLNIFYFQMGLFLLIDCPFRNLIAIAIILIAINFLVKNKKIKFIVLTLVAFSFHKSAIFFIFLIFYKNLYKLSKKQLWFGVIILFLVFSNVDLINKILILLPTFKDRIAGYIGSKYGKGEFFTFGNLEKLFFITLILLNKDKIKKNLYIFSGLYILLYRIAVSFNILGRIAFYLQLFYILGIVNTINNQKKIFQKGIIVVLFIYECLVIYKGTAFNYKYVPYTSYLNYIFKEKPDYEYRNEYNYKKFHERTEKNRRLLK